MAAQFLSALAFIEPRISQKTPEVFRARRALRGFARLAPPRARMPLPWAVVALIIVRFLELDMLESARLTAIGFVFCTFRARLEAVARRQRDSHLRG